MRALRCLALLGSWVVFPAHAADVQDWLSRMAKAESHSYQGAFVYERNGSFSTHGIWHEAKAGAVRERLLKLDGPAQEVVRVDGNQQCVSGGQADQLDDIKRPAPMLKSAELSKQYEMRVVGDSRVANRDAVVLALVPRDQHRYALELHLDKETALPLKSLLISEKGELLERFQFITLDTSTPLTSDLLQASAECKPVSVGSLEQNYAQAWKAGWLPPGFSLDQSVQRRIPASAEPVTWLVYGDGLARFSVFLEPLHGLVVDDARSQFGPTAVVSRRMSTADGDMMVTVVGEVPLGAAERVALSMQPSKTLSNDAAVNEIH